MALVALIIGALLIVTAFRNTQGQLATALMQDVPGYLVWAAAVFAVGAIGFIPKAAPISRMLMALVLTVLILKNYTNVITGFEAADKAVPTAAAATPAATTEQTANAAGYDWTGNPSTSLAGGGGFGATG
jgi:hypothetical protein